MSFCERLMACSKYHKADVRKLHPPDVRPWSAGRFLYWCPKFEHGTYIPLACKDLRDFVPCPVIRRTYRSTSIDCCGHDLLDAVFMLAVSCVGCGGLSADEAREA